MLQVAGQLTDGAFVSIGERLQVRLRTGDHPRGTGFKALYHTVAHSQEQRVIMLENNTIGTILHLNYPAFAPSGVDYLQRLIAPVGHVIVLELHGVRLATGGCPSLGVLEIIDNYADSNGTTWRLCGSEARGVEQDLSPAPLSITSYLNTVNIRQTNGGTVLVGQVRVLTDPGYKVKLVQVRDTRVESCEPNPCLNEGRCVSSGTRGRCRCPGQWTGLMCGLSVCELAPCVFGECLVLASGGYRCKCRQGYKGPVCDQRQKPCDDNPCESRGDCIGKGG